MINVDNSRAPFVRFERRAVEDRTIKTKDGGYGYRDEDFIILVPHGCQGRTVIEQVYSDWLQKVKNAAGRNAVYSVSDPHLPPMVSGRFPDEWIERIEKMYAAWKEGQELPIEGMPISSCTWLSPAQRAICLNMHIFTVEQLANATDETCGYMGIGGMALRQRARDFLKLKSSSAEAAAKSVELEELRTKLAALEARNKELEDALTKRKAAA